MSTFDKMVLLPKNTYNDVKVGTLLNANKKKTRIDSFVTSIGRYTLCSVYKVSDKQNNKTRLFLINAYHSAKSKQV